MVPVEALYNTWCNSLLTSHYYKPHHAYLMPMQTTLIITTPAMWKTVWSLWESLWEPLHDKQFHCLTSHP